MEHVVFYPAQDGSPAFRRLPTLDEAVRLVEHLRNVEGVAEVSVHTLAEVPLAFKAYYRVEMPVAAEPAPAAAEPVAMVQPVAMVEPVLTAVPTIEQAPAAQPVPALAGGRAADAKTSLGFFVS